MKNHLTRFALLVSAFFIFNTSNAQKVAGFFPDWVSASLLNNVQYTKLTDIYYAFIYPNSNGNLLPTTANGLTNILSPLATKCKQNGVKIHISIGGANNSGNFSAVVANSTRRQTFVNDLANLFTTYGLDGVDIDWEFPAGSDASNLTLLMQEIRTKLDQLEVTMGKRLYLSMAVAPLVWNTDGISATSIALSDYIHIMAFDAAGSCCVCDANNHSSMLIAQRALQKWTTGLASSCGGTTTGKNATQSKLVLAIPFYSTHVGYEGYNVFSASNPSSYFNDADGVLNGRGYNSCPLIQQKVDLIMKTYGGAGIWTWELTQDRSDQYSLLSCMHTAMQPYLCSTPAPSLGNDQSICGLASIALNSGVSTASGRTFTWKRGSTTLVSNSTSANTYNITQAGTYSVEITQSGCSKTDEIVISGTLSAFDLGATTDLCSPSSKVLNTGYDASGKTFVWTKNGVTISGATSPTYTATSAGTYAATVSASGCTSVSDNVVITSSLPSASDVVICSTGNTTLTASTSVSWFAAATGGLALQTGTTYTSNVTSNKTFYIQAGGGSTTNTTMASSFVGNGWQQSNIYGTKFTVSQDLTLKSVDVNAEGGAVTINVVSSNGTSVVRTKTFPSVTGLTTLTLDFALSAGTYYLTSVGSVSKLYTDITATSNYTLAGIISVEGNVYWDWGTPTGTAFVASGHYGNFINLKVITGSTCDRVPVNVTIDGTNPGCVITSANQLDFSAGISVYPNPSEVNFTVQHENLSSANSINLFDMNGKLLQQLISTSDVLVFGEDICAGTYLLEISTNEGQYRLKVVKTK